MSNQEEKKEKSQSKYKNIDDIDYQHIYSEKNNNNNIDNVYTPRKKYVSIFDSKYYNLIVFIAMIISAFFSIYLINPINFVESHYSDLELIVVDDYGKPIKNATIVFVDDNKKRSVYTNEYGYLQIKFIEKIEKIDILIREYGYKPLIIEVDLDKNSNKNRIIQLMKEEK